MNKIYIPWIPYIDDWNVIRKHYLKYGRWDILRRICPVFFCFVWNYTDILKHTCAKGRLSRSSWIRYVDDLRNGIKNGEISEFVMIIPDPPEYIILDSETKELLEYHNNKILGYCTRVQKL